MNYELAKQLKDAGFPQGESFENIIAKGTAMAYIKESKPSDELLEKYETSLNALKELYKDDKEYVYVPTLSELIEACGDRFCSLSLHDNSLGWFADGWDISDYPNEKIINAVHGSTPEEAVANLWLILNKEV